MKRYEALSALAGLLSEEDLVVATEIGATSAEWHSLRPGAGTIYLGMLGGPLPFGLGVAAALPNRRVVVIDTDGSMLFGVSSLCPVANERPANLTALILDNEMYQSVGGHPSATSQRVDIEGMAVGAGITATATAREPGVLKDALARMLSDDEVGLIVAKIDASREPLTDSPAKVTDSVEDKYRFLRHIESIEGISIRPRVVAG